MQEHDGVFTEEHLLRLLQLWARRAVEQRRERKEARGEKRVDGGEEEDTYDGASLPEQWRLLPESVIPHRWQMDCLRNWFEAGCRGTVKVATGGGKTAFALLAAQRLQNEREPDLRVAVVVPTIPLMFQWRDELRASNLPASAIALMGGGYRVTDLSDCRIVIAVLNSAREHLPRLVREAGWSDRLLLIVDECHRAGAKEGSRIFEARPKYTIGLSATPEPGDKCTVVPADEWTTEPDDEWTTEPDDEWTTEPDDEWVTVPPEDVYNNSVTGRALGRIVYDFTIKDCLEAGLLTQFEVWHIGLPLTPEEALEHGRLSREITELRRGLEPLHRNSRSTLSFVAWCQRQASQEPGGPAEKFIGLTTQRKRLLYRARARTVVTLRILAEECTDPDTRAILFHEVLDETERIFLEAQGAGLPVVLEHSELPAALRNDSIDAFRTGVARVIVSARSLIEGFNVPSADLGIIVASTGSVRQRIQSLGRLLRRKEGGRKARVYVLYIRGTGDEAIYEKADWEDIVGAERNRYFVWEWVPLGEEPSEWKVGLKEVGVPPRPYRPPCDKVNVSSLRPGDPYPGRTCGDKVRVDQQGNLRAADDRLLRAPREVVDAIVGFSPHRRAVVVPCGHVIARAADNQWVFLGRLSPSEYARGTEPQESSAITLEVMRTAGRRRIAQKRQRDYVYPRGPREVEEHLLRWVEEIEHETGVTVRRLAWDGNDQYWVDVQGETRGISLPPLQFPAP